MPTKRKPGSIVRTKNGRYAKVLPNGRWRFISAPKGKSTTTKKSTTTRRRGRKKQEPEEEEEEM